MAPAWFWMKFRASIMNLTVARRCTPIVSMPMTPLARQSYRQKVEPVLDSISNEIDSKRHIWKNVLYCIYANPEWFKKWQNMKPRGS